MTVAGPSVLGPGRYVVTVPAPHDRAFGLWRASRREAVRVATSCPSKAWRVDDPRSVKVYGIEVERAVTLPAELRADVGSWVRAGDVEAPARAPRELREPRATPARRVNWRAVGVVAGLGVLGYLAARRARASRQLPR